MSKQSNFNPDENLVVFGNLLVHGTVTGKGNVVFNADTQTVNDADGYVINSDSDVAEAYLQINSNAGSNVQLLYSGNATCLLYTSPSPRDQRGSRMPSSA